jgi:hypothetical protein
VPTCPSGREASRIHQARLRPGRRELCAQSRSDRSSSRAARRSPRVGRRREVDRTRRACYALEPPIWDRFGSFAGQPLIVVTVIWTAAERRVVIEGRRVKRFEELVCAASRWRGETPSVPPALVERRVLPLPASFRALADPSVEPRAARRKLPVGRSQPASSRVGGSDMCDPPLGPRAPTAIRPRADSRLPDAQRADMNPILAPTAVIAHDTGYVDRSCTQSGTPRLRVDRGGDEHKDSHEPVLPRLGEVQEGRRRVDLGDERRSQ